MFFIRNGGFTVLQNNPADAKRVFTALHERGSNGKFGGDSMILRSHSYNVDFVGANPNMQTTGDKPLEGYKNYILGGDPSKWASRCGLFQAIDIKNVYPNIDVRYYTDKGVLKYDIIVRPGGDPRQIMMRYEGADKLEIRRTELVVKTSVGELRESPPYSYQPGQNGREEVNVKYKLNGNILSFDVKEYNKNATLVIDPTLIFCSFSRSTVDNWGYTATYGPDGSFFGGGIAFGQGFPTRPGAFQQNFTSGPGNYDIVVMKLSSSGGTMIYGTYVGGGNLEQPHSLVVDPSGNLVIAGRTNSPQTGTGSYPITHPTIGAGSNGDTYDIVVTKLNADGTALIGSSRIGGTGDDGVNISAVRTTGTSSLMRNYGDDGRSEVILDASNNIYLASCTRSNTTGATAFPTTPGSFGPNFHAGGLQDAVVLKMDPNATNLLFSGMLGGSANDAAYVLALGLGGEIFVAGGTESTDFDGNRTGTVGPTKNGGIDGFVAVIAADGSSVLRSTYIGANNGEEQIYGLQIDQLGFPYVLGTSTADFPVSAGVYSNAGGRQFIAKLRPDLSAYVYSTVFGSGPLPNISPTAFLVDRCENVYVSGWGGRLGLPSGYTALGGTTNGLATTADAVVPPGRSGTVSDGNDFYFIVLRRDATALLYASFYGIFNGQISDHVDGGTSRFDRNGVIYQAVCASCLDRTGFPTTASSYGATKPNDLCNIGMIKIRFNLAGVGSEVQSAIGGVPRDTAGCFPLTVNFTDHILNATEYIWNFGDNGTGPVDPSDPSYYSLNEGPFPASDGYTRPHTFNNVGTYTVMLIAVDPNSCNVRDTSFITIKVGDLKANLDANVIKLPPCEAFNYQFNNLSTTLPIRPFTDTSFIWDFGDNTPRVRAGMNPVNHTYPGPGTYDAWLYMVDTAYCNYPDSFKVTVRVSANVRARFSTPPSGCSPYEAFFTNESDGGATFEWNFGDPASGANNTSTAPNPSHLYNLPGTYTITLVANDPNTCNLTDTMRFTITVAEKPTALFSYSPTVPQVNVPITFSNQSSANSIRFKWIFGDGDTLLTTSRANIVHQYNATGEFDACLVAFTQNGCTDTTCLPVRTLIEPALDVPNAFTPNSGDQNSVIMPRGYGIAKLKFIIWNRWGQKVFETNTRNQGWDGKFKGVLQPMDVYAYTLEVEFSDGTRATKKGDITLIR